MKKFICVSTKEAFLIHRALSYWTTLCSLDLNSSELDIASKALDDLDLCDKLRLKISKTFPDLSRID